MIVFGLFGLRLFDYVLREMILNHSLYSTKLHIAAALQRFCSDIAANSVLYESRARFKATFRAIHGMILFWTMREIRHVTTYKAMEQGNY